MIQRVRVLFAKGEELRHISHLDLLRAWERALRRAKVPLAYSQGFNPRPRLFFAAALPLGCTARAEMVDIFLDRRLNLPELASRIKTQLPAGLGLGSLTEVGVASPALPSLVVAAEYQVYLSCSGSPDTIQSKIDALLAAESIPRRRVQPGRVRSYDLRPLVQELVLVAREGDYCVVRMRLQADAQGTGRPDEVMSALGLSETVCAIERTRLLCREVSS